MSGIGQVSFGLRSWLRRASCIVLATTAVLSAWGQDTSSFHRTFDLRNWSSGGELSRYIYLHTSEFFPTAVVERFGPVSELSYEEDSRVGGYEFTTENGESTTFDEWVQESGLDGYIVLHHGRIVYETYPHMRQQQRHLLWSVTKAMIGTIVGILEERGDIDRDVSIDRYISELEGTAWSGISVGNILKMASGIDAYESTEALFDTGSAQYRFEASIGWLPLTPDLPTSVHEGETREVLASLRRAREPGERVVYSSVNTEVLGWMLEEVTGKPLVQVLTEELWSHIGAESDAFLLINKLGMPVASGGMVTTLRDLARFGLLFTDSWNVVASRQVVSPQLVSRMQEGGQARANGTRQGDYQWDGVAGRGAFYKQGFGGNLLMVFPAVDVVVAYFGTNETLDSAPASRSLTQAMVEQIFN